MLTKIYFKKCLLFHWYLDPELLNNLRKKMIGQGGKKEEKRTTNQQKKKPNKHSSNIILSAVLKMYTIPSWFCRVTWNGYPICPHHIIIIGIAKLSRKVHFKIYSDSVMRERRERERKKEGAYTLPKISEASIFF